MRRTWWRAAAVLVLLTGVLISTAAPPAAAEAPRVHALTGVRIVVAPGEVIESGTVVIRDGVLTAVGADVEIPADARLWKYGEEENGEDPADGETADPADERAIESETAGDPDNPAPIAGEEGKDLAPAAEESAEEEKKPVTVYAGLIDPYTELDWPVKEGGDDGDGIEPPQDVHANPLIRPEREMSRWAVDSGHAKKLRQAGFTTAVVAPEPGILRGVSALVNLGDGDLGDNLLLSRVAQNVTFDTRGFRAGYPTSLMGALALLRQTWAEAVWYAQARAAYERNPGQERPPYNRSLAALQDFIAGDGRVVFETENLDNLFRAARLAEELDLDTAWLVGNGDEYRRLDAVAALGRPLLLPLAFPEKPEVGEEDDLTVSLQDLRHWDRAPHNPAALLGAGVPVAFTSHGLDDAKEIHPNLARALGDGLTPEQALAALTTTPAELLGIADRAGTVEAGKMANLVVVEGELFVDKPQLREVWIDGRRYELEEVAPPEVDPVGTWELTITVGGGMELTTTLRIEGEVGDLSGVFVGMGQEIPLAAASVSGKTLSIAWDGTPIGMPGAFDMSLRIQGDSARGSGSGPRGSFTVRGNRTDRPGPEGYSGGGGR